MRKQRTKKLQQKNATLLPVYVAIHEKNYFNRKWNIVYNNFKLFFLSEACTEGKLYVQ